MKTLITFALLLAIFCLGEPYSKYGRKCQDIGCTSHEECVLQEDPCSRFKRTECGTYPTCKRVSRAVSTCTDYVCPPTQTCRIDEGQPRCFDSGTAYGQQSQGYQPQQTTVRPNIYQSGQHSGSGGYQGGNAGSGYPGNPSQGSYPRQTPTSGYPTQSGGYPGQDSGYPGQNSGYPGQGSGYPGQGGGYPGQGGGYPAQGSGYPGQNSGYPGRGSGYPGQSGGYPAQGGGYPGQNSGYPAQNPGGAYPSQGAYPRQNPGYPTQGGYPAQSGYPNQDYYSQRGYYNQNSQTPKQETGIFDKIKAWGADALKNLNISLRKR